MRSFKDVDKSLVYEGDFVKIVKGNFREKVGSVCEVMKDWVYVELDDGAVIRARPNHLKLFTRNGRALRKFI